MPGLRFDTEQDYQRFLTSYQSKGKTRQKAPGATITPKDKATPTDAAKRLLQAIVEAGIEGPWYREFTFHEDRNWRLDVACPSKKLCVEIDGQVHRIKDKFARDIERHNALIISGWRYIRCTPTQVDTGEALILLKALLAHERKAA